MTPENPIAQPLISPEIILAALESENSEEIVEICQSAHPGDIEVAFDQLDEEDRETVLKALPLDLLSELSDHLPATDMERRVSELPEEDQKKILGSMSDDELVDLLQEVPAEQRPEYLELLPEEKQEISEDLLQFPEHTAGGRMTAAVATVNASMTIREALDLLAEQHHDTEILSRIYVIEEEGRLQGETRLRDLAFSSQDKQVKDIMEPDLIAIDAMADQEEAAQMIARYDLMALPVVDEEFHLLGLITHDDAMEILEEEHTEDIERASGIAGERGDMAYLGTSVMTHLKRRLIWVLGLAFLALFSGYVMHRYETVLTTYFILAIYLPMVVAAGGNTGAQAATMVIRAMSLGELGPRSFLRVIATELQVGLLLGGLLGMCVALQINFLLPTTWLGLEQSMPLWQLAAVVGFSLTAQVMTSTFIGAALPIGARALKLDPAVVASPAITTVVDVSGMIIYFTLARLLLPF